MNKILSVTLILLFCLLQSCGDKSNKQNSNNGSTTQPQSKPTVIKLEQPQNGSNYTTADKVDIRFKTMSDSLIIDSTILSINGKHKATFSGLSYQLSLAQSPMGMQRISLSAYAKGIQVGTLSFACTVKPQHSPKTYGYQVVNTYPHSTTAYTQGLYYHNGFLYEGTGQYGQSALRKVNLQTGKILQNVNIDAKYFGEGICLFNNRIYQLTWQNRVGFIYNAETFEKISEFGYSTEGWGITTDGTYLIMSDGTQNLYFIDPANMQIVRQVEVYSDTMAQKRLNELEYINGEVWANIYGDSNILRINPETGEVTGMINLKGLIELVKPIREDDEVLNGVAYDPATGRIFVTGKNWSKLFEIKIG